MSEFVRKYRSPLGGAVIGRVLAAMIVTIGFFKTILAVVIIVLGAYAGIYVQRTGMIDQFFYKRKFNFSFIFILHYLNKRKRNYFD
ncbi:DUF2273 domain-containing protein [Streptococcus agalactiae]|nr:DUF2273 domain-containing protein [Streptococcus agalactiae]